MIDNLNPKFRHLVDLLLFTDRQDINFDEFKDLYFENTNNSKYLIYILNRSMAIYWYSGLNVWKYRFKILLKLGSPHISNYIEENCFKNATKIFKSQRTLILNFNIEIDQYFGYLFARHELKLPINNVRHHLAKNLVNLPPDDIKNLLGLIIPNFFKSGDHLAKFLVRKFRKNPYISIVYVLFKQDMLSSKEFFIKLIYDDVFISSLDGVHIPLVSCILKIPEITEHAKQNYNNTLKKLLLSNIGNADSEHVEIDNFQILKQIGLINKELPTLVAEEFLSNTNKNIGWQSYNYLYKLYIKLLKNIPEFTPKMLLANLSSNNQMPIIKLLYKHYPELKKLSAFV